MKKLLPLIALCCLCYLVAAQKVGIGTTTVNQGAILDIQSTNKGVIFPNLTKAQREAIVNPPDGLMVFSEHCLYYYNGEELRWNCFCPTCNVPPLIIIDSSQCGLVINPAFLANYPSSNIYTILIPSNVTISGCSNPNYYDNGKPAIQIEGFSLSMTFVINNRGTISGGGGFGGIGSIYSVDPFDCPFDNIAFPGTNGGDAIKITSSSVSVHVNNHGIIAGGGGGGGGGGGIGLNNYGGGGGGGAGIDLGSGGYGGGQVQYENNICFIYSQALSGENGTATTGGAGGSGVGSGSTGGAGGGRGQIGQNGLGSNGGIGGLAGKVISGGTGNTLTNNGSGTSYGTVD